MDIFGLFKERTAVGVRKFLIRKRNTPTSEGAAGCMPCQEQFARQTLGSQENFPKYLIFTRIKRGKVVSYGLK